MFETGIVQGEAPASAVLIVAVGPHQDGGARLSPAARRLDDASGGTIRKALEMRRLKHGETLDLVYPAGLDRPRLIVLALGKEDLKRFDLMKAGAGLAKRLEGLGVEAARLAPPDGLDLGLDPFEATLALVEGALLKSYRFDRYKGEAEASSLKRLDLELDHPGAEDRLRAIRDLVAAVDTTRDLISEPANVLYPKSFAERTKALEAFGVEVEIMPQAKLEELKMGALLGVAQGSAREPFVVVMRYANGGDAPPLALVGKGVCFDSGGISIKPAAGMQDMKWDMGGAGIVVGAMQAIAARKAKANVVGVIGLVENMPSGTAQRPGDVVTTMAGKTVEVINTDAEGRLVLADVLWYVKEHLKPKAMIDLATLTGAVTVALGHERAGLFANDDPLADRLFKLGEETGDLLWRLPMGGGYDAHIKSQIADMKNTGRGREAGSTAGATFLKQYVGEVPWAHLDVAGVVWAGSDLPLATKGATGFGVRLLDRLVREGYEVG